MVDTLTVPAPGKTGYLPSIRTGYTESDHSAIHPSQLLSPSRQHEARAHFVICRPLPQVPQLQLEIRWREIRPLASLSAITTDVTRQSVYWFAVVTRVLICWHVVHLWFKCWFLPTDLKMSVCLYLFAGKNTAASVNNYSGINKTSEVFHPVHPC